MKVLSDTDGTPNESGIPCDTVKKSIEGKKKRVFDIQTTLSSFICAVIEKRMDGGQITDMFNDRCEEFGKDVLKSDKKPAYDCQTNFGSIVNAIIEAEMSKDSSAKRSPFYTEMVSEVDRNSEDSLDLHMSSLVHKGHDKNTSFSESDNCYEKCVITGIKDASSCESDTFVTIIDSSDESSQDSENASMYAPKIQDIKSRGILIPQQYLTALVQLNKHYEEQRAEAISTPSNDLEICNKETSLSDNTPFQKAVLSSDVMPMEECSEKYDTDEKESICSQKTYGESSMGRKCTAENEKRTFQTLTSSKRNIPLTIHTTMPLYIPTRPKYIKPPIYTRVNKNTATLLKNRIQLKRKRMHLDHLYQHVIENRKRYSSHANTDKFSFSGHIEPASIEPVSVSNETQASSQNHSLSKHSSLTHSSGVCSSSSRVIPDQTTICLDESSESKLTPQSNELTAICNAANKQKLKKTEDKILATYGMKLNNAPKKILKPKIDLAALNHLKAAMKFLIDSKIKAHGEHKKPENLSSAKPRGNSNLHPTLLETGAQIQSALSQLPMPKNNFNYEKKSNAGSAATHYDTFSSEMQALIKEGKIQSEMNYSDQQPNKSTVGIDKSKPHKPSSGNLNSGNSICFSGQQNNIHISCDPQNVYIINVNNICEHDCNCCQAMNDEKINNTNINDDFSEVDNKTYGKHLSGENRIFKTIHGLTFSDNKQAESAQSPDLIKVSDSDSDSEKTKLEAPITSLCEDCIDMEEKESDADCIDLEENESDDLMDLVTEIWEEENKVSKFISQNEPQSIETLDNVNGVMKKNESESHGTLLENKPMSVINSSSSHSTESNANRLEVPITSMSDDCIDIEENESDADCIDIEENESDADCIDIEEKASDADCIDIEESMSDDGCIDLDENESDELWDLVTEDRGEENLGSKTISQNQLQSIETSDNVNGAEIMSVYESSSNSDSEHEDDEDYEELDESSVYDDDDFYDNDKEEIRRKRGRTCSASNSCYVVLTRMKLAFSEDGTLEKEETNDCNVACRKRFVKSYVNCLF